MIGVTEQMTDAIRKALAKNDVRDGFIVVEEMDGYALSRTDQKVSGYTRMFSLDIDGEQIHVYLKL